MKQYYDVKNVSQQQIQSIKKTVDLYKAMGGMFYLRAAIKELDLKELEGYEAGLSYATYHILKMAEGSGVKENLFTICSRLDHHMYEKLLIDFHLLYWEWDELKHNNPYREYWPEATLDNIEGIVIDMAKQWIVDHKNICHALVTIR